MQLHRNQSSLLKRAAWSTLLSIAAFLAVTSIAYSQVLYGTLTGNVTDVTGAVIPGASVHATNTGTGVNRSVTTNSSGIYSLDNLQAGTYNVTVTSPNFASFTSQGVTVNPNEITRVDASLAVKNVSQQVTVTGAPPLLQTDKADVNYDISTVQLAQIPTTSSEGRNFQALYKFVPGMTPPIEQNSSAGNPERAQAVNANGISWVNNNTRVDGAGVSYPWLPYLIAYIPPQDAIASVNIVSNSFTADQGTAGGSVINVTVKSGTNQFHGSAWEYNSENAYNANSFFRAFSQLL